MNLSPATHLKKQKGRAALAAAALFLCFLVGCGDSGALVLPQSPSLAVIDTSDGSEEIQMPDVDSLLAAAEEIGLDAAEIPADPQQLSALVEEEDFTAAVICLSRSRQAEEYLDAASEIGLPLIFLGAQPEENQMARYDKCWYLGTNPESEGEQLGETLFRFWESGQISDRNADKLLQTVVVTCGSTEDSRAEAVLRIFENYGVYSDDPVFLTIDLDAGEDPAAMISAQLMLSGSTDLVLIADPSLAPSVAASCASAGVPAAAFGEPDGTAELLSAGSLLAYSRFDTQNAAALAVAFAENVSHGRDATDGTGQRLDEVRRALLPVEIITAAESGTAQSAAAPADGTQLQSSSQGGSNG